MVIVLRLGQLVVQDQANCSRAAAVLRHYQTARRPRLWPFPQLCQRCFQRSLQSVDDFLAQDGQEFIAVAAAAGGEEQIGMVWVVCDEEIALGSGSH